MEVVINNNNRNAINNNEKVSHRVGEMSGTNNRDCSLDDITCFYKSGKKIQLKIWENI